MRVVILGCGSSAGVPQIGGADGRGEWGVCDPAEPRNRRSRASIVLEQDGNRLLVDTSPDMRSQLVDNGIPRVDAILFTHAHADHINGLDDVRILNRLAGRPLDAFADRRTLDELERRFDYAFRPWQPPGFFRPVLVPHEVAPGERIRAGEIDLELFDQDHGFVRTLGLRASGFAYSTDVVAIDEAALAGLEGLDTWLVDCFQRPGPHKTHFHLELVLSLIARLRPRRAVLTHMGLDMDYAWLRANLPEGVEPAYDGQVLEVG